MKKVFLMLCVSIKVTLGFAQSTTTTTTEVYGKNEGSTINQGNGSISINCNNAYSSICYKQTSTTTTPSQGLGLYLPTNTSVRIAVMDGAGQNTYRIVDGRFANLQEFQVSGTVKRYMYQLTDMTIAK